MTTFNGARVSQLKINLSHKLSLPLYTLPVSDILVSIWYMSSAQSKQNLKQQEEVTRKCSSRVTSLCLLLSAGKLSWIFTCFCCHLDKFIQIKQRTKHSFILLMSGSEGLKRCFSCFSLLQLVDASLLQITAKKLTLKSFLLDAVLQASGSSRRAQGGDDCLAFCCTYAEMLSLIKVFQRTDYLCKCNMPNRAKFTEMQMDAIYVFVFVALIWLKCIIFFVVDLSEQRFIYKIN